MTTETERNNAPRSYKNDIRSWRKKLIRRIRNWASRKFPALIESSNIKQSRNYYREKDHNLIPESIPHPDEIADLKAVYAAEFYTPAHAQRLMLGFKKMGWDSEEQSAFHRNHAEWVSRSRRDGSGIWINLGGIVSPKDRKIYRDVATAELPAGFKFAHAELFAISSSVNCIVIRFDPTHETEVAYGHIAREQLATELRKTKRGFTIIRPRARKTDLIGAFRESFRKDILNWFASNLPGAFSSNGNAELFPTCEVLFLDNVLKRANDSGQATTLWLEYLGINYGVGRWASIDIPGLGFTHPVSHRVDRKGHAAISVERGSLNEIDISLYGDQNDDAYLNKLSLGMSGFICQWSVNALIDIYRDQINSARDTSWSTDSALDTVKILKRLQNITSNSVDVSLLASELPNALSQPIWDSLEFSSSCVEEDAISLSAALTDRAIGTIGQLVSSDKIVRDSLLQQGNLINALEAVQTQRNMARLTTIMMWLTVAIFLLTTIMAYPVIFPAREMSKSGQIAMEKV
ncbi:hypothetical protein V6R85_06065 [Agrobacterium sp. CCNWLW32]|uniref:hypothetical protein n=1 Tax=Agrobacterium sp. CCNWLW32 TaxID=3122072 RepID=UPI00300FFC36